jgi:hypothetical protein
MTSTWRILNVKGINGMETINECFSCRIGYEIHMQGWRRCNCGEVEVKLTSALGQLQSVSRS